MGIPERLTEDSKGEGLAPGGSLKSRVSSEPSAFGW